MKETEAVYIRIRKDISTQGKKGVASQPDKKFQAKYCNVRLDPVDVVIIKKSNENHLTLAPLSSIILSKYICSSPDQPSGLRRGYLNEKLLMLIEPPIKRTYAFFDGQNLFYACKEAFGYKYPNYAPWLLAQAVCRRQGWQLDKIFFYTGVPSMEDNVFWNHFWTMKLAVMGTRGVNVYSRELRYRHKSFVLPDGSETKILVGQEKGIDIRIALDIIRFALDGMFDVALIFSQDEDLSEVADDIRKISQNQSKWIKIASAFPVSSSSKNSRGIYRRGTCRGAARVGYRCRGWCLLCLEPRRNRCL